MQNRGHVMLGSPLLLLAEYKIQIIHLFSRLTFVLKNRVLKPPGGGSSNLFGSPEEVSSSNRTHKMASNIFGATDEPQNVPKRTNPPGESHPIGWEGGCYGDKELV